MIDLVPWTDPVLYKKTKPFNFGEPPVHPVELANDLIDTMIARRGIGLAAPQIGFPLAVFVLWGSPAVVVFNPRIVDVSDTQIMMEEACLTYPGLVLKLKRPALIKVRYQMPNGETITRKFEGLTARAFQHETEHTLGIPFFANVSRPKLDAAVKKANKAGIVPPYSVGALLTVAK